MTRTMFESHKVPTTVGQGHRWNNNFRPAMRSTSSLVTYEQASLGNTGVEPSNAKQKSEVQRNLVEAFSSAGRSRCVDYS